MRKNRIFPDRPWALNKYLDHMEALIVAMRPQGNPGHTA